MPKPHLLNSFLLLLLVLLLAGCSPTLIRVKDRREIDAKTMFAELHGAPVVFAGERHDVASHHKLQLEILRDFQSRGRPLAIAMEMFEDTSQRALDAWSAGKAPEFAIRKVFEANWRNISWGLYSDIMQFARDHEIPVVALNPPRQVVQKVAQSGFASLTREERGRLPEGIDASVDDAFVDLIVSSYPSHGKRGAAFRYLCEAQMLRNKVMARHIEEYLQLHPDRVMVVIAGGGHARKTGGIPEELGRLQYKVLLPAIPTLTRATVTTADADYLIVESFSWLGEMF